MQFSKSVQYVSGSKNMLRLNIQRTCSIPNGTTKNVGAQLLVCSVNQSEVILPRTWWMTGPGPVIKCFVILPNSRIEKKLRRNRLLDAGCSQIQGTRPDHVRVESSSCCFHRELASFVRPREVSKFSPTTCDTFSSNHRKRILVGGYNKSVCLTDFLYRRLSTQKDFSPLG